MTESQFKVWGEGAPVVMMDWGFAVLLTITVIVFLIRAFRRQLSAADFVVIGLTFVPSLMIIAMGVLVQHQLVTFWRYHYPGYVLALGYVAHGIAALSGRWKRQLTIVILGVVTIRILFGSIQAVRHSIQYERHAADNWKVCDEWAAEVIRKDWRGPARCLREPLDLDFYITDYLPLVFAHTARTSYVAHARTVTAYRHVFANREQTPDYFVLFENEEKDVASFYSGIRREKIAERKTRYGAFSVYKTVKVKGDRVNP